MKTVTFLCAALLVSSIAAATTPNKVVLDASRQRVVSYADLDLNKASDAEKLYRRIKTAARDVCWMPGLSAVVSASHQRECIIDTTQRAVAEVNAPGLKDCTRCTHMAHVDTAE